MDSNQIFSDYEKGYKDGYLLAAQQVASVVIRLINNHPSWVVGSSGRKDSFLDIQIATKQLLCRNHIIPFITEVVKGVADDVPLDFNLI